MKVNNYFLNMPVILDKNVLKEGSIFKGKILDIFEDEVLIDVKGYGSIKADLNAEIKINIDDEINFLVKSTNGEKVEIKPLSNNQLEQVDFPTNSENSSILKLFEKINNKNINISHSKLSTELIKNLMEYNVQLSEENLTTSIKALDKLIELSSIDNGKKVILLEKQDGEKDNITYKSLDNENIENNSKVLKEFIPEKSHIKYLLVTDKNSYPKKEDLSLMVKDFLFKDENIKIEDFPKILSFLIKNNIKLSLRNIKNIREFNDNPLEFLKEFSEIKETIKNNIKNKEFINLSKIMEEGLLKKEILEINKFSQLEKIIEEVETIKSYNLKEEINILKNKINFLKEINKELSFIFIPINYKPGNLEGIINFLKGKKKKARDGKTNVFISLNTKTLGNIKISCQLYMKNINVKISINKKDLDLFKSRENHLIKKILDIGYNLKSIKYVINEDLKVIEDIATNENPTYFLDIKV